MEVYGRTAPAYGESRADVWGLLTWRAPFEYGAARVYGAGKHMKIRGMVVV